MPFPDFPLPLAVPLPFAAAGSALGFFVFRAVLSFADFGNLAAVPLPESVASAIGGLGGGVLLDLASFRSLTIVVAAALLQVVFVVAPLREREPGEFVPAEG